MCKNGRKWNFGLTRRGLNGGGWAARIRRKITGLRQSVDPWTFARAIIDSGAQRNVGREHINNPVATLISPICVSNDNFVFSFSSAWSSMEIQVSKVGWKFFFFSSFFEAWFQWVPLGVLLILTFSQVFINNTIYIIFDSIFERYIYLYLNILFIFIFLQILEIISNL